MLRGLPVSGARLLSLPRDTVSDVAAVDTMIRSLHGVVRQSTVRSTVLGHAGCTRRSRGAIEYHGNEQGVIADGRGSDVGDSGKIRWRESVIPALGCAASVLMPSEVPSLAAVVVEPVCSETGHEMPATVAATLARNCARIGASLISDETRCGLGRVTRDSTDASRGRATLLCGVRPPLSASCVVIGEGLGGGYASCSAVLFRRDFFRGVGAFPSTATQVTLLITLPCFMEPAMTSDPIEPQSDAMSSQVNDNLSSHLALAHLRALASIKTNVLPAAAAAVGAALHKGATMEPGICQMAACGLLYSVRFNDAPLRPLLKAAHAQRKSAALWCATPQSRGGQSCTP